MIATDINLELLADLTNKENYLPIRLDVTVERDIEQSLLMIAKHSKKIDVLVSNAGIVDFYSLAEAGGDKIRKIFDVNVLGLVNLTKHFLPLLIQSKGRLIVISSESYKIPAPFQPYAVSKQALESLYDSIKLELMLKGVRSVLIRPGAIETQLLDETINFPVATTQSFFDIEFTKFIKAIPKYIGKISTPEEVAKIILMAGRSTNPKAVYHINNNKLVSLLSLLPKKLQSMIIRKSLQ